MALQHYHNWSFPIGAVYSCSIALDVAGYTECGMDNKACQERMDRE